MDFEIPTLKHIYDLKKTWCSGKPHTVYNVYIRFWKGKRKLQMYVATEMTIIHSTDISLTSFVCKVLDSGNATMNNALLLEAYPRKDKATTDNTQ